mmetsp:Transcript_12687/g.19107  ORF Transcript_12687/g.19107 Transcript_12687/m.19107 type:complete len:812 (-) Transcript_12687:187-2622(-)|eukprot:CAMPEP_0196811050 /NCGR_PEP_ID=MMETSP1362-20130617/16922_1 /TAXON_ID=163516 /ORGANISM="Leptocylindrus danicus, Strain CCMP1856" /LENGTH=811 /DNA_ID=CAMNT_0042186293 /DNA_START=87 /DNA_END=2522 /DNA_ORIENTATION=+
MSSSRAEALRRKDMKIADKYKESCPPNRYKDLEPLVKQLKGNEKEIQRVIQEWWEDPGSTALEPEWENVSKKTPKQKGSDSFQRGVDRDRDRDRPRYNGGRGGGRGGRGYRDRDNHNGHGRGYRGGGYKGKPRHTHTANNNTTDTNNNNNNSTGDQAAAPPVANVIIDPKTKPAESNSSSSSAAVESNNATNELPMSQKEDMIIPNTPTPVPLAVPPANGVAGHAGGSGNVWATKGSAHIIQQQQQEKIKQQQTAKKVTAPVGSKKGNTVTTASAPSNASDAFDAQTSTTEDFTIPAHTAATVEEPSTAAPQQAEAVALDMVDNLTSGVGEPLEEASPSPWANAHSVSVEELVQEAAKTTLEDTTSPVVPSVDVAVEQPAVAVAEKPVLNLGRWGEAAADTAANNDNFDFVFGTDGAETEADPATTVTTDTAAPTAVTNNTTSPQAQASPARPPPGLSLGMPPMPPGVVHVHELENKLESTAVVEEPSTAEPAKESKSTETSTAVPQVTADSVATTKLGAPAAQPPSTTNTATTNTATSQPAFPPYGMEMGYGPMRSFPGVYNAHVNPGVAQDSSGAGNASDLPPGLPHAQPPPYGNMQHPHPAMYYQGLPYGYGYQFGAPGYGGYGANPYTAPAHDMSGGVGPGGHDNNNQGRAQPNRGYRGNKHYQNQHTGTHNPQYNQYNPQMMGYGQHAQPPYNAGYGGYGPDMGYGMQQAGYGAQPDVTVDHNQGHYNGKSNNKYSNHNRGNNGKYGQNQSQGGGVNQHLNSNNGNGFPQGSALQDSAPQQGGWSGAGSGLNNHQWGTQGGWQHQG